MTAAATLGCGPFAVHCEADSAVLLDALTAVFAGAPPPAGGETLRFRLRVDGDGDGVVLEHPAGRKAFRDPENTVALVQGVMLEALSTRASTRLLLHAAALVSPRGRAVLLPAGSGTGKSTAALALARRGWRCLSDDLAFWELGSGAVHGTDFAICLKAPPPSPLNPLPDGFAVRSLRYLDLDERPAELWACAPPPTPLPFEAPLEGVAFLMRGDGAPVVRELTPGEAVTRLWRARVRRSHATSVADPGAIARGLQGVRIAAITTSRVDDVAAAIAGWADATPRPT